MNPEEFNFTCPLPTSITDKITLSHGNGGSFSHKLFKEIFLEEFRNSYLEAEHDGAAFEAGDQKFAFSTDSFVISPLFFPGGDIGKLAVCGTVNDLAMCGAEPLFISAAFILEEGFDIARLKQIVKSMRTAADEAGVKIITGDTKVVEKGKGDGVFINTSGIGIIKKNVDISPARVRPGDAVILSGTIADHGMTILSERENLKFESSLKSDCASLNRITSKILSSNSGVHCMRDPTRGGLATSLNEIAMQCGYDIYIFEDKIKINNEVRAVCEILGFDPLYVANEGKMIIFTTAKDAVRILRIIRSFPEGKNAEIIGNVSDSRNHNVILKTIIGTSRIVDMLSGEQLPRIC